MRTPIPDRKYVRYQLVVGTEARKPQVGGKDKLERIAEDMRKKTSISVCVREYVNGR